MLLAGSSVTNGRFVRSTCSSPSGRLAAAVAAAITSSENAAGTLSRVRIWASPSANAPAAASRACTARDINDLGTEEPASPGTREHPRDDLPFGTTHRATSRPSYRGLSSRDRERGATRP